MCQILTDIIPVNIISTLPEARTNYRKQTIGYQMHIYYGTAYLQPLEIVPVPVFIVLNGNHS